MNGVLNIDKPGGMTSHDVVARIRRIAQIKRVGHAGTLDPDATGVLLICLGTATRLADFLAAEGKTYRAVLALGRMTDTEDASGTALTEQDASHVTEAELRATLPRFTGEIAQVPPMVSAVHHEGRRLYALARQGITVERAARTVRIDELTLRDFTPGSRPAAVLEVACGKGTYIRTLCADIGAVLGVGGHMAALRRMSVGRFSVADAVALDAVTQEDIAKHLTSPSAALSSLPAFVANPVEADDIRHGRALAADWPEGTVARVVDSADNLLALARMQEGWLRPFAVFVTNSP